jgi:hypothetical protein
LIPLKNTVTVIKSGIEDSWGVIQPGASVTYKCRIDYKTQRVLNREGVEVTASATILIKGLQNIEHGDWVQWSDALNNVYTRKPIRIEPLAGFTGKILFTRVVV